MSKGVSKSMSMSDFTQFMNKATLCLALASKLRCYLVFFSQTAVTKIVEFFKVSQLYIQDSTVVECEAALLGNWSPWAKVHG